MSTILPWENEEEQNYICMEKIVNDVVSNGLRKVFKQEWNNRYQPTFGAWDDTNVSGQQLFHIEKTRSRPNKNAYQAKFQNGDTNQWDCSVLFDAILYSNSISKSSLNPRIQSEVNNLREIRNEIKHITEGKLSNSNFLSMTTRVENALVLLGLPVNDVNRIKFQRNRYKSFQVLPEKPTHDTVYRSKKAQQIIEDLQKLYSDNDGKLTYFYICGNPGCGKSQLARQVCEDLYRRVNWQTEATFVMTLDGKDLDTLLYTYEDFCRRLNCNESVLANIINSSKPNDEKIKDLRSQVSARIKNWKRWWLIVDNVENLANISQLLPQMGDEVWDNGQIILTTQNRTSVPADHSFTKHVSISLGMNKQECRQLLALLSSTDVTDPLLDAVAEKLDRQPLAMAAAAIYMRQVTEPNCSPEFSWQDYLGKLEKGKTKLAEERLLLVSSAYSSTMSAAVFLAVEKCAESHFILNQIFHLFSLVSFQTFPLDLILVYMQQQEEEVDTEDIYLAIKCCSLLIHAGCEDRDISIHRVTHEAIKLYCHCNGAENHNFNPSGTTNRRSVPNVGSIANSVLRTLYYFKDRADEKRLIPHLKAFHTAIKNLFPGNWTLYSTTTGPDKTEICEIYLFFAQTLRYYCDFKLALEFQTANLEIWKGSREEILLSNIYNEHGSLNLALSEFAKAKDYYERALKIRKEQLGPNHVDVAVSYNNLGNVYCDTGQVAKAKDYYEQALEIRKQQLGANHVDVAASYNNLGNVYWNTGEFAKAREYYQWALEIRKEQLGPNHVDIATSYNNLGNVYRNTGDFPEATAYHQRALEIRKEQLGPNHVDVAASYNNLGNVYRNTGEFAKVRDYYERALEIQKEQLGPNHVKVADSYNNLGTVYHDTGEFAKATDYHQQALEIRKEQLDANHVDVAASYNNLGNVYRDTGEFAKAKDYYQRALEIQKEQLGPNHVDVATFYNNLGNVYRDTGEFAKAKDYYEWALEILKEQLGPNHVDVAAFYNNLGIVYHDTGDLAKAKDNFKRALEIREEKLGPNHVKVAYSYNNLGSVYVDTGEFAKAKDYHQRALEIRREQLGPNHVKVADSYNNLGTLYGHTGEFAKAKDYHQRALEIQKEQLGPNHVDVAVSYNNLGTVYRDTGEFATANDYYEWALEIRKEQLGPNHGKVAASYNNLGILYRDRREFAKATDYHQRALEIQKEQLGPNHVDVALSYNNLGDVYRDTGEFGKATDYYQRALQIRKELLGPNHLDVAASYNNLGNVYRDTGEFGKAKDYHERALEFEKNT